MEGSGKGRTPIYVDVTTNWQEAGKHPHGTTRVSASLIAALCRSGRADVRFFRFDRAAGRFLFLTSPQALEVVERRPVSNVRREGRRRALTTAAGRRAEAWFRFRIRDPFRRWLASLRAERPAARAPAPAAGAVAANEPPRPVDAGPGFEPGAWLFFPGEMQRHDFARLMKMRSALGLRYAFVFYDLHDHLAPDDPKLRDPDASELPGTDFLLREGGRLFSISRFSTAVLETVVAARGAPPPPVTQIVLSGLLPSVAEPRPVPGLVPGGFVLAVGDVCIRKNQTLLFEVWRRLAASDAPAVLPLVCVGRIDNEVAAEVEAVRTDARLAGLVRFETNLEDDRLVWLYRNCRFTVFASLNEGFGLPVAESLSVGKPCVASSAGAIPEAGQGLAVSLDPADADAWTRATGLLMADDAELARQVARARQFHAVSWSETAASIVDDLVWR